MALKTEARKPLYAVVGAGDLAVENIKELPTQLVAQATTIVPKTRALVSDIPAKVPAIVKDLRGDVEGRATSVTGKAFQAYGELVERGQKLVTSIRRSSATEQAEAQIKIARSQAKAAATSATKAAKATAKAVDKAADKVG
ncbi:MAG TPA: hypothetical protein VNA20_07880 [Frankiaceae bacterium]|nr:hypothetical protein [Frankiaceae bacterium]